MRITAATVIPYSLPLRRPHVTAAGVMRTREGFLVRVETASGIVGWGDAAPLESYTRDTPAEVHERLGTVAGRLAGMSVEDAGAFVSSDAATLPTVAAALDSAIAGVEARSQGVSVAAHLGTGTPLAAVPVHALISGASPADVAAAGAESRAQGYPACKLKVGGRSPSDDIDRLVAVRDAVGEKHRIRLDANGAWTFDEALVVLEAAAALGVEYVEDPVADWATMAELRDRVEVPLAADQLFRGPADVGPAGEIATVAVVKPSAVAGPARALDLADAADRAGLRVLFGSLLESAVGLTVAVHTAAAWGRPDVVSGLATGELFAADVAVPPLVANGAVSVPAGLGLGISVTPAEPSDAAAHQLPEGGTR